jgi:hypothetical protein
MFYEYQLRSSSSRTHSRQVATFESLTPNVVKRHEELQKIYSHHDPDVKVNIPDPALANLGKGMCDAESSKEGEEAVRIIFKTTLMRPDAGHSVLSKPQKTHEEDDAALKNDSSSSAPYELLSGNRMPDIQWLFRRPPTPYTGVMQKVLESGYGTKHSMRRMLEAFQSVDANNDSRSPALASEDAHHIKPFKILTFRGLPLPPPPQSRATLKRLLTIIQADWDVRRKGGLLKGDESMVPVVPIPRKPTVPLKYRDRVTLAEAAALGNLKTTLASLGLAMSSQGALVRAGTDMDIVDGDDEGAIALDATASEQKLKKSLEVVKTTSLAQDDTVNQDENVSPTEPLALQHTISSQTSLLFPVQAATPPGHRPGKAAFKTIERRPNSNFACVSRPKSALAALGSDHKDVQNLPRHVKSGAMPPRAPPRAEEDTALYWQSKIIYTVLP